MNELPSRLDELDKDKIIVTACPHKDRAILAMAYLRTKGYRAISLSRISRSVKHNPCPNGFGTPCFTDTALTTRYCSLKQNPAATAPFCVTCSQTRYRTNVETQSQNQIFARKIFMAIS